MKDLSRQNHRPGDRGGKTYGVGCAGGLRIRRPRRHSQTCLRLDDATSTSVILTTERREIKGKGNLREPASDESDIPCCRSRSVSDELLADDVPDSGEARDVGGWV